MKLNNLKLNAFFLILQLLLGNFVFAQDKCKEEVRGYYNKLKNLTLTSYASGKTIYSDCTITMIPKAKEDKAQTSNTTSWISDKKMKFISNHMSVYKDEQEAFTVLPDNKMIVVSDALPPNKDYMKKNASWNMLQDTMFLMSSVKECEEYKTQSGELMKKIVLVLNKKASDLFHVSMMTFDISETHGSIKEIKISYPDDRPKEVNGIEFTAMEIYMNNMQVMDDGSKFFPKNIEDEFFASGHKLRKLYSGYQVIDKRNLAMKK